MIAMTDDRESRGNPLAWLFRVGPRAVARAMHEGGWRDALRRFRQSETVSGSRSKPVAVDPRNEWAPLARIARQGARCSSADGDTWRRIDDHSLQDIGLTRVDVQAAAYGLLEHRKVSRDPRRKRRAR